MSEVPEGEFFPVEQSIDLTSNHPEATAEYAGPQGYAEWEEETERLERVLAAYERMYPDVEERKKDPGYNVLVGELRIVRREYIRHLVARGVAEIEELP